MMKALLVAYVMTGFFLLITAGLMYRFELSEGKVKNCGNRDLCAFLLYRRLSGRKDDEKQKVFVGKSAGIFIFCSDVDSFGGSRQGA